MRVSALSQDDVKATDALPVLGIYQVLRIFMLGGALTAWRVHTRSCVKLTRELRIICHTTRKRDGCKRWDRGERERERERERGGEKTYSRIQATTP